MSSSSSRRNRQRSPAPSSTGSPWGETEEADLVDAPASSTRTRRRSSKGRRHERRGSGSSVHSAGSVGSAGSRGPRTRKSRGGKREAAGDERPAREDRPAREERPRTTYSSRTREHRERRVLDDADDASAYSSRSGRSGSGTGTLSHEDEIERIRELRARRLRNERLERGAAGGDNNRSKSPNPSDARRQRERRRDRDQERAGRGGGLPSRIRSTPLISRKELEDAGLVRRERRDKLSPTRTAASSRTLASIPDDEIASYSRSRRSRDRDAAGDDDDDTPRYSRRDRSERAGQDESLSAYRIRRERERAAQEEASGYRSRRDRSSNDDDSFISSRTRRERSDRSTTDDDDASGYSRASEQRRTRRVPSSPNSGEEGRRSRVNLEELRARREDLANRRAALEAGTALSGSAREDESATANKEKERQAPGRSLTGGDELRVAGNSTLEGRHPPARARSADLDIMGMNTQKGDGSKPERPTRKMDRDQNGKRSRSTDLTTRLRERREARNAERQASNILEGSDSAMSSARRRILRQRSNDEALKEMAVNSEKHSGPASESAKKTPTVDKKRKTFMIENDDENAERIPELEFSSDEEGAKDALNNWSVRISVVSAVDLPLNIVPNMPLCPVLKIGLVKLPQTDTGKPAAVIEKLGSKSIESLHSARVRSTTSKILSKRDNGTVDFHQEMRWDSVKHPMQAAVCIELCARAVRTPKNFRESPPLVSHNDAFRAEEPTKNTAAAAASLTSSSRPSDETSEPTRGVSRSSSGTEEIGGLRGLWKKATNRKAAELEAAEAAAAVARMLVEQDPAKKAAADGKEAQTHTTAAKTLAVPQSDYDVTLRSSTVSKRHRVDMTEDKRLGTLVVPLTNLPLEKATNGNEAARVEQWYQLEAVDESISQSGWTKKPSVLLEISFSSPEILDDSEDELEDGMDIEDADPESLNTSKTMAMMNASFSRRSVLDTRAVATEESKPETKAEDPVLKAGVVDFIAVVGCKDIGKLKNDDGAKGWVDSSPESVILEQFPPDNEFHQKHGRTALLPEMCQWFCFPEGTKLWRGTSPPSHSDLNLKRFSASSPPSVASSIAAFDACLGCTTSFSWFVIASNSDEYGSKLVKTYSAVIRFYAPAPAGIDPTQEDFAQTVVGEQRSSPTKGSVKRLWVPVGICLTSNLPIIGIMEAMLLRLCEELVSRVGNDGTINSSKLEDVHKTLANLIVNFQKPIAGAVNCSVPFLGGERFLLTLPPPTGLPALPHGRSVVSVCRLLGAEGLNFLLAAILTECKILFHSQDIADLAMVAEVGTALAYPFSWSLPYIPILPLGMLEFIEAPLSYMLGIPSSSLKLVDPNALDDVVVIDLDNGFSSDDYYDGRRLSRARSKSPTPLPASVATNISKAVYRLLRAEEEVEEEFGETNFGALNLPRLEQESLAEREFRITVAMEITGLLRGYQECVGQVFNRDKFLKIAPALFEERRDAKGVTATLGARAGLSSSKVISPRSKRFLSLMVNSQNFHQFIESLESDEASFFHEIMETFEDDNKSSSRTTDNGSKPEKILAQLSKSLQKVEDKIPTYRVDQNRDLGSDDGFVDDALFFGDGDDDSFQDFDDFGVVPKVSSSGDGGMVASFTSGLLAPVDLASQSGGSSDAALAKLEANPWDYQRMFDIPVADESMPDSLYTVQENVKLRDAIGERRYRAWKMAQDQKAGGEVELNFMPESIRASKAGVSIDLNSLISSATQDTESSSISSSSTSPLRTSDLTPEQQRVADAKHRDVIRRCMDKARVGKAQRYSTAGGDEGLNPFLENGRDLIAESEKALRSPSAQRFLLSILSQRSRLENQRLRTNRRQSAAQATASRVEPLAFDCLVRLCCAMLDSCMEFKEYEPAYRLLTHTAGFIMIQEGEDADESENEGSSKHVVTMTSRIGLHPIFADLGLWEKVMSLHLLDRQSERKSETRSSDGETEDDEENNDELEYEAAVATLYEMVGYGIPGEELSRFAMRSSEEHGWFCDDRGRQLLMLARRISIRRDQADLVAAGETGDIDMIRKGQDENPTSAGESAISDDHVQHSWVDISWCHPAAPTAQKGLRAETIESGSASFTEDHMKRSPVTALACFGSTVVVTGGLDGSVFMAHSITENSSANGASPVVRGIHLDWGSASRAGAGSSSDGEYGVGAVSCLAAAGGTGQQGSIFSKASNDDIDQEDIIASMEGSRVVAGTTAGDLRVWSVKDVYSAIMMAKQGENAETDAKVPGSGGHALTRLKFSLRGRALSGHRGGVTCIDVPSYVYRPDSLVTGGADGLIKLWSLRAPTGGRRTASGTNNESDNSQQRGRGGDALSVLSGHGGRRVMCIKTAWHGDRLLSGGADRTIRIWDMGNNNGKCLHTLTGHFGWITKVNYWGPNTIISASTDRSLALWDARVRNSPLFMLRHHHAPVSDFIVGTRTDPLMISAAADGTIATWDFRTLSDSSSGENTTGNKDDAKRCRVVRSPAATMTHEPVGRKKSAASSVFLTRVVDAPTRTFMSAGSDAIVREWVASTGDLIDEASSGHCDAISSFQSYGRAAKRVSGDVSSVYSHEGTITTSWDGTVRMRKLKDKAN